MTSRVNSIDFFVYFKRTALPERERDNIWYTSRYVWSMNVQDEQCKEGFNGFSMGSVLPWARRLQSIAEKRERLREYSIESSFLSYLPFIHGHRLEQQKTSDCIKTKLIGIRTRTDHNHLVTMFSGVISLGCILGAPETVHRFSCGF